MPSMTFLRRAPCLLAVLLAAPALATTLVALDVEGLTRLSDVVVRAQVLSSQARITKDGARIVTDSELEVLEVLKGAPPKRLIAMQPGGVVGEIGQKVDATARFEPGEEVVVFLERRGERYTVAGMQQGRWKVERSGGKAVARPQTDGDALYLDPTTHAPVPRLAEPLSLDELFRRVKAALPAPAPAAPPPAGLTPKGLVP